MLKRDDYLHPVAVDCNNIFAQMNELLPGGEYNTFLLDSDNKVLAIGNPVLNPKVKELYKMIMLNDEDEHITQFNGLYARSVGVICRNATSTVNCFVVNKDSVQLHIQALVTSCDCVTATANSDIMLPYAENEIRLKISTDSLTGDFSRYVDIFYEEKDKPDRLTIYGIVK